MRTIPFLLLIAAVICLAGLTIALAQMSGVLALLPAVGTVGLVLTVLIRRAQ
ncbi:hypothetical protein [Loktanella salsilacus]|uniref:hypothetical protein n=1 Tax=Loktanella salsilacus TaxID=195913 RepID=UPI0037365D91